MSIETEPDRLDIVRTLAGIDRDEVTVRHPDGAFVAIFDNGFADASFDIDVESSLPVLTARTSDVEQLRKDTPLHFKDFAGRDVTYDFDKHEPDGTGMSRVLLSGG